MRKTNDKSIKEAIEQMLNVYKLKRKFDETGIKTAWPKIMGKPVANRTKQVYIFNRKLFLQIESSVIRSEIVMMKSQIIEKVNDRAGSVLIDEIILL